MIKPLTETGRPGAVLQRPAAVETQIAEVLGLEPDEILERARITERQDGHFLSSECLVHLIRHALCTDDKSVLNDIFQILLNRCTANLRKTVAGVPEHLRHEVVDAILQCLIEALLSNDGRADFFEVKFNLAFMRLRFDVIRRWRQDAAFHYTFDEDDLELPSDESRAMSDPVQPPLFPLEDVVFLRKALRTLNTEEYEILLLRYCSHVPINPSDTGAQSIVKLTGLSERTIRNRLNDAKEKLRTIMKEEPHHESDESRRR